jgi:NAD(P)-dependent dehydrogenase (short-subunit alcohol dehydrogenase family)
MQKVAFITGCSTGIGFELAHQLNRLDWKVVATARNSDSLKPLQEEGCLTLELDVTNQEQIETAVDAAVATFDRIDLLINNAGYGLISPTIDLTQEEMSRQFGTNVFGTIMLIKKAVPVMKLQHNGVIVNIGSISGIVPTPFSGAYCASKAAVHAWSDVLRMELKPFGIRVITVEPGGISSNFGQNCLNTVQKLNVRDSWYAPVKEFINRRAGTSQEKATPVEDFVQRLIMRISKENPPAVIRLGRRSFSLPFMKRWIPAALLDKMMIRKFGLDRLGKV